jgi:hypothetical protein
VATAVAESFILLSLSLSLEVRMFCEGMEGKCCKELKGVCIGHSDGRVALYCGSPRDMNLGTK